jgi:hypothetical protein
MSCTALTRAAWTRKAAMIPTIEASSVPKTPSSPVRAAEITAAKM